jgi:porphobilinogen deaminase
MLTIGSSRIEIIRPTGDKSTDVPLAKAGTKGRFTKVDRKSAAHTLPSRDPEKAASTTPMLTIASKESQLARWQARWMQSRVAGLGRESRIEIIRPTGDKITGVPLAKAGRKGLFTKEAEEALLPRYRAATVRQRPQSCLP